VQVKIDQELSQLQDDQELLKLMMNDFAKVDPIYKWTNYWYKKSKRLYSYLLSIGLKNFRRNNDPKGTAGAVLRSFGATDLICSNLNYSQAYDYTSSLGHLRGTKPLKEISISTLGNPEDLTYKDGCYFTFSWLNFYLRYSYVGQFFNFDEKIIVELGSGSGKQAEMIKKAHPSATILIFDIAPQLYVQNQYLKGIFPNDVIDYYQTREISSLKEIKKGKIYIFSNSQFQLIADIKVDLFWNAASFQEMEPKVVEHYLSIVRKVAKNIYLMQLMEGQSVSSGPGTGGVIEKVTLETYRNSLASYKLVDLSKALYANKQVSDKTLYSESFWQASDSFNFMKFLKNQASRICKS
jgi:putative sugar O-methyltransferase